MVKEINNNMNDFTKKVEEVALYIRVSTEEQAINGDSLRTQREALTKFALANHYHIYGIYEDDGFSATNLNRPALQRLLEDVRKNKINRILLTKLDRLSRGVRNYYKVLDVLDAHCVFWQTIFEKYDSSTASGRLHINIMLSVAENESAQTSERIRSVFNNKIHQKEIISGKIPIGYKKEEKKLVVDEDKKALVIDAFNFYLKSGSVYKTFEYLSMRTRPPLCCKSLHVSFRMSLTRNPHRQLNRKACLMISCRHGVAISNFNSSIVRYSRRLGSCLTLSAKSNSFVGLIVIIPSL